MDGLRRARRLPVGARAGVLLELVSAACAVARGERACAGGRSRLLVRCLRQKRCVAPLVHGSCDNAGGMPPDALLSMSAWAPHRDPRLRGSPSAAGQRRWLTARSVEASSIRRCAKRVSRSVRSLLTRRRAGGGFLSDWRRRAPMFPIQDARAHLLAVCHRRPGSLANRPADRFGQADSHDATPRHT